MPAPLGCATEPLPPAALVVPGHRPPSGVKGGEKVGDRGGGIVSLSQKSELLTIIGANGVSLDGLISLKVRLLNYDLS